MYILYTMYHCLVRLSCATLFMHVRTTRIVNKFVKIRSGRGSSHKGRLGQHFSVAPGRSSQRCPEVPGEVSTRRRVTLPGEPHM